MKRAGGLFVAGTDTGVGKTMVTAALVAALRAAGVEAWPVKPVQTGAVRGRAPDLDFVLQAAGLTVTPRLYRALAPVRLPLPASPHLAARAAGRTLRLRTLVDAVLAVQAHGGFPVVEGAGGLLVPLNARDTMLDLVQALGFPVVLVGRSGLGTLNHTLLSAHALDSADVTLAGVILSHAGGPVTRIEKDNLATLRARLDRPVLGLPRLVRPGRAGMVAAGRRLLAGMDLLP